jgi:hypothetical protein
MSAQLDVLSVRLDPGRTYACKSGTQLWGRPDGWGTRPHTTGWVPHPSG